MTVKPFKFVFQIDDRTPRLDRFDCIVSSLGEAVDAVRSAGFVQFTLLSQEPSEHISGRFGPQTEAIDRLIESIKRLSMQQSNSFNDEGDEGVSEALSAARALLAESGRSLQWDEAWRAANDHIETDFMALSAQKAIAALVLRDLVAAEGFTPEHYRLLTETWREAVGAVHLDDAFPMVPWPSPAAMAAVLGRGRLMSEDEIERFDVAWRDLLTSDWHEITGRARHAVARAGRSSLWLNVLLSEPDAIADTAHALLARDLITEEGFTQSDYHSLTRAWRLTFGPVHPHDAPSNPAAVATALGDLAHWQAARNATGDPIVDVIFSTDSVPPDVGRAREVMLSLTAEDVLDGHAVLSLAGVLNEKLAGLTERELGIFRNRVLTDKAETLEALGKRYGVTRERIRQLESLVNERASEWMSEGTALYSHAVAVRQRIGGLNRLDRLIEQMPDLAELVTVTGQPAWFVIDKLDDAFESDGTWVAEPSLERARTTFLAQLELVTSAHGTLDAADVLSVTELWPSLTPEDADARLAELGYSKWHHRWLAPSVSSVQDKAVAYLSVVGKPSMDRDIHAAMMPERNFVSMKNALGIDPRITRVDRGTWALVEWGASEYQGLKKEIEKRLRTRGALRLSELVDELTSAFAVSGSSVVTIASAWPFAVVRGKVIMAWKAPKSTRSIAQTRLLYACGDGWAYRITVNADHLRGSGFSIPIALTTAMNLDVGETRTFSSLHGPIAVPWRGGQAAFGSVRQPLIDLNAEVGDQIMIRDDGLGLSFVKITPLPEDPIRRLRALVGLPDAEHVDIGEVALAIGLVGTATTSEVVALLESRGEAGVSELTTLLFEPGDQGNV